MPETELLIEKAKTGQLVMLIGMDLRPEDTAVLPAEELAHGLAAWCNVPDSASLARVAQKLKEHTHQWKYTRYLNQVLPAHGEPGPLHKLIASLLIPFLVTTAYDDRLARALEQAGRPANVLIKDSDLQQRRLNRPDLVKLCGDLGRLDTLVVARKEYEQLADDEGRRELLKRTGTWLQEKAVLMVGCNPAQGSDVETCLYPLLNKLGAFGAGGYLVWPHPAAADAARWAGRGVRVIDAEPLAFLESLGAGLQGAAMALPPDQEMEAIKGLLHILRGAPAAAELEACAAQVPASERLKSIRVAFDFELSAGQELQAALNVNYDPDIDEFRGKFKDTGITLEQLREWANEAGALRRKWKLPQGSAVEHKGLAFFEKIVPPGSEERRVYEDALYLRQTFANALYIVFDLRDALGRLSLVPWELLHDGNVNRMDTIRGRGFLGLKYPVYRRLAAVSSPAQVAASIQKALVIAADPTQQLAQLEAEVDWLVAMLKKAGVAQVDERRPTDNDVNDPQAIKALIRDGGYQLVYFTGHGLFDAAQPARSCLVLGLPGEPDVKLTAEDMAEAARESALTLVFFSACELGGTAAQDPARPWEEAGIVDAMVDAGVPAAIGMQWKVGQDNSRKLVETFYGELPNTPPERALMIARQAIQDQPDWVNPILTKRHGVLK